MIKKLLKLFTLMFMLILPIMAEAKPANEAFDDDTFYNCVVDAYNKENSNNHKEYTDSLTDEELRSITSLICSGEFSVIRITSTKGLEKLTSLTYLQLDNVNLGTIDVRNNPKLTTLDLSDNNLSEVDVSKNTELKTLFLRDNKLSKIDLSNNPELTTLDLSDNNLSEVDVSKNTELKTLFLRDNKLSKIDLSNNPELTTLDLSNNNLSEIDVSKNTELTCLRLSYNNLNELDVSKNIELTILDLNDNNFSEIDVTSNTKLTSLNVANNNLLSLNLANKNLKEKWDTSFDSQTRELKAYKKGDKYILKLKDYDNNLDSKKVVFENKEGIEYDDTTGIFAFTTLPKEISYIYKTGLKSETGISEEMDVTITLIDGGEYIEEVIPEKPKYEESESTENDKTPEENSSTGNDKTSETEKPKYADQKPDNKDIPQTGGIAIGTISVIGIIIYLIYKYKFKKDKIAKL